MDSSGEHSAAINASLDSASEMVAVMRERATVMSRICDVLISALRGGGKLLTCGNGGSAAEAMHLSEELVGRFSRERKALPAICLCADSTALTCIANDWDYAEVFARQIDALGRRGDVLVALSTSGRSHSIVRALERAKAAGIATIGLLGTPGSDAEKHCDHVLTLVGVTPPRVQEAHLLAIHLMLERIDAAFG